MKHESNRENTEKQLKILEKELKLEKQMLEQLKLQQQSQQAMFNLFQTFLEKNKGKEP